MKVRENANGKYRTLIDFTRTNVTTEENDSLVIEMLNELNGKAKTHTFKHFLDIRIKAYTHLQKLGIPRSDWKYVRIRAVSGEPVSKNYNKSRILNVATLYFDSTGKDLLLTELERIDNFTMGNYNGGEIYFQFPTLLEERIARQALIAARKI